MSGTHHNKLVAGMVRHRGIIVFSVTLATVMQALDTTIANVALPYIQGTVAASQDQISWVLTSYIVAAAIMTPPTAFLAGRFGRKRLFMVAVAGFTLASVLCGMAQSLVEIVGFRMLQGFFGAALVPLSQAVLLDITAKERQGQAIAMWGMAVMVGPVLGPVIGGWLTDNYSWRWVFYINVPLGIIALLGMGFFLPERKAEHSTRLDWLGFGLLSLAIGAMQVMLDRGELKDWFSSSEIIIETVIAVVAFYLFLVHTFTTDQPFVSPTLFRNRNFAAGTIFIFLVGITYLATLALMTPYLHDMMNYPIVTTGIVMGPRGIGTMLVMAVVGRLVGRVDTRLLLLFGLLLTGWALYDMTGWTPDVSEWTIVVNGLVQGAGLGLLFVPLSVAALATLSPEQRTEGAGIYNLSRNIGSSVGISVMSSLLTSNTEANHAQIMASVTPFNAGFRDPAVAHYLNPTQPHGAASLEAIVTNQAQIIAYLDDYKLMMILTLAAIPLLLIFTRPPRRDPSERIEMVVD